MVMFDGPESELQIYTKKVFLVLSLIYELDLEIQLTKNIMLIRSDSGTYQNQCTKQSNRILVLVHLLF